MLLGVFRNVIDKVMEILTVEFDQSAAAEYDQVRTLKLGTLMFLIVVIME